MNHMIEKSEQKTSQVYNISHAFHVALPLVIFHKAHFFKKSNKFNFNNWLLGVFIFFFCFL